MGRGFEQKRRERRCELEEGKRRQPVRVMQDYMHHRNLLKLDVVVRKITGSYQL